MALSTIDRVREAETKAYSMQTEAERAAERVLSQAEDKAAGIIADAQSKAAQFDAKAAEEAKSRVDSIIRERREKAQAEADALTEKTLKLKQNVINKLIQETLV